MLSYLSRPTDYCYIANSKPVASGQATITLAFIIEWNLVVDSMELPANVFELYELTKCKNRCVSLLEAFKIIPNERVWDSGHAS